MLKLPSLAPISEIRQLDTHRLIATKYRVADKFLGDLTDDADLGQLRDLDNVTNDRLLSEENRLPGIDARELVFGVPYWQLINNVFTHANPNGSRFNGSDRGAWYAGFEFRTVVREVTFHRTLQYQEINRFEDSATYDDYLADFSGTFHDLRDAPACKDCLSPVTYRHSQALAEDLLGRGSLGIIYPSVREEKGTCLVCFRPALVGNVRIRATFRFTWSGAPEPKVEEELAAQSRSAL